ncbi:protein-tyrosine phosphatase [Pullulanibacillus pueri]|uniref:Tyrosine-protein phosphatase n=1 Tax=Pullulanibacillus pueri TaxID=1437324 RepID=A0A8J3ENE4_9BACL|nr:CpsB/CapC family capsule biosynthesis tyrosine phosphatase [Pullulanibacillus pueri]MBM7681775.1 protein-tyrosine phosphatase [Pullulanibacillus pueri]GGH84206.1 tyrosine protein phosphatase [Pullulanibacillus pueri]
MIDLHCHILPGIDDGAQTEYDALDMACAAVENGITKIVATPHHKNGAYENPKAQILKYVEVLNELLGSQGIPLEILPGQEVRIYGEIAQEIDNGALLTMNNGGHYVFIEFPSSQVPRYAKQLFYDMQLQGITPIIVHPERNHEIQSNPMLLYNFIKNGALSQVTAASLLGRFGKKAHKLSVQIIENNLTHFIATDAHNTEGRGFLLQEAYADITKLFGTDYTFMYQENAELLLEDKVVNREIPTQIKEKKFLGIF